MDEQSLAHLLKAICTMGGFALGTIPTQAPEPVAVAGHLMFDSDKPVIVSLARNRPCSPGQKPHLWVSCFLDRAVLRRGPSSPVSGHEQQQPRKTQAVEALTWPTIG
jgi:hypothetical protein